MTARDDISAMKAEYMGLYGLHLRGMLRWDEAKYRRMVMLENLLNAALFAYLVAHWEHPESMCQFPREAV